MQVDIVIAALTPLAMRREQFGFPTNLLHATIGRGVVGTSLDQQLFVSIAGNVARAVRIRQKKT